MSDLIARLKAAHEAATPGPWKQERDWGPDLSARISALGETLIYDEGGHSSEDAELIVLTRNALPEIIAALEERERLLKVAEAAKRVAVERGHTDRSLDDADITQLRAALDALEEKPGRPMIKSHSQMPAGNRTHALEEK